MNNTAMIAIYGEAVTLSEFLQINLHDKDVQPIDKQDADAIARLKIGQSYMLPVHFGYEEVKRIA